MITVVDYGVNNVRSVVRAIEAGGHAAQMSSDPAEVRGAERVLLPGVGHFGRAIENLERLGLKDAIREAAGAGRPVLGICLGMQLCFAGSEEAPDAEGFGFFPGTVRRFRTSLPVPHVGWTQVQATPAGESHPLSAPVFEQGEQFFYHVHSYHAADVPDDLTLATADYAGEFPTIVARDNIAGFQFHPEKSQEKGIALLRQFAEWRP
ncbi:MAG TPA: imidazole glycerol phosphate synthase subunit HisH [Gemmatimonadales bacterium]|nr:imidazole glycerol phosphate synthase subunit HisH [Gemmatimonadales bacterium]